MVPVAIGGDRHRGGHLAGAPPERDCHGHGLGSRPELQARSRRLARRDAHGAARRRSPYYVPIVGQPGEVAAMTAARRRRGGRKRLFPEGYEPNEHVAARIFLQVGLYSPGNLASKLRVPWLVQVASEDLTTPVRPAIKAVLKAPKSQLIVYRCGHFDVYVPPRFGQTVEDQLTFLKHCLK